MANSDKNIIIVPNTNQSGLPNIQFIGSSSAPISLNVLDDNTVSFSGSQGQLFAINNNLTSGTIFSVNDVSGIPLLEADASGTVSMARFGTSVAIGKSTANAKLDISGSTVVTGALTVVGTISASNYLGISGGGGTPGGTNSTIQFNSGSTFSGSTNLVWDYTNNRLGVGTSTPNAKLDVNGNTVITGTLLTNIDTNSYSVSQFKNSSNGTSAAAALQTVNDSGKAAARIVSFSSTNNNNTFGTTLGNATGFMSEVSASRMIVSTQGESNIEIGTNSNTTAYRSILINQGPGNVVINPDNSSAIDFIVESTGSSNMLFVDASTNSVGIGTSTPNSTLDVNGNTIISGNLTVTGSIFVSGSSIYGQVAELTSSTANYTLVRQDSGKFLHMSSSTSMNLTVPSGLPVGFTVSFCQNGTGSINVVTGSGVFVKNRQDHTKTAGYGAVASLICTGSNGYIFTGDTSA